MSDPSSVTNRVEIGYAYGRILDGSFPDAVSRAREATKAEGFGGTCEIDIKEKFKEKLGVEFTNYVILGACNPPLNYQTLQQVVNIGLLLPCKVVVCQKNAQSIVAAFDRLLSVVGNPVLKTLAEEVNAGLRNVIDGL